MSSNRGCFFNTVLFLVIVFVPILGHILATLMVLEDDHSTTGKILWLAIVWLLPPWVVLGPLRPCLLSATGAALLSAAAATAAATSLRLLAQYGTECLCEAFCSPLQQELILHVSY
jgi:hypothetical protein